MFQSPSSRASAARPGTLPGHWLGKIPALRARDVEHCSAICGAATGRTAGGVSSGFELEAAPHPPFGHLLPMEGHGEKGKRCAVSWHRTIAVFPGKRSATRDLARSLAGKDPGSARHRCVASLRDVWRCGREDGGWGQPPSRSVDRGGHDRRNALLAVPNRIRAHGVTPAWRFRRGAPRMRRRREWRRR